LQARYRKLVKHHLSTARGIAAGLRALPQTDSSFAAAQAAWRFYANPRVCLPQLAQPLLNQARAALTTTCDQWALVLHDWSPLHYTHHEAKADRIVLYNKNDFGYLLQAALLLSDRDGEPLAPLYLGVEAADGVHSTRRQTRLPARPEIDELNRTMGYVEQQLPDQPVVHIIDRQADSILHLRRFARCGRKFLIRGNDVRRVQHHGQSRLLSAVEAELHSQLQFTRKVLYKGKPARQSVAATLVTLEGEGRKQRRLKGKLTYRKIKGRPLQLRLVIAQVQDKQGAVLATWRLWTNLEESVSAATLALWYYWRWRIETFFKLLKRAGQHLEQWQQESAQAVAKRLLVAAQALIIVWGLMQTNQPAGKALRQFLIRLSGRLMQRGVEYTGPALLAGMWNLLSILDALERYSLTEIEQMARLLLETLGLSDDFKGFKEHV
jgi:hypothetical protein